LEDAGDARRMEGIEELLPLAFIDRTAIHRHALAQIA